MANRHLGNIQPQLDLEEHTTISGVAGKKVFNIDSSGNVIDFGSALGSNATYANISVGATATQIVASDTTRKSLIVQNISGATVFVGTNNSVTSSNGIRLLQDDSVVFDRYDGTIFGIADATGHDVRFLAELD